jgi:hypothetical protein
LIGAREIPEGSALGLALAFATAVLLAFEDRALLPQELIEDMRPVQHTPAHSMGVQPRPTVRLRVRSHTIDGPLVFVEGGSGQVDYEVPD